MTQGTSDGLKEHEKSHHNQCVDSRSNGVKEIMRHYEHMYVRQTVTRTVYTLTPNVQSPERVRGEPPVGAVTAPREDGRRGTDG